MTGLEPCAALAQLRESITSRSFGQAQLVLLTGGVGSGKTTVLRKFVKTAASAGILALAATGSSDEWDASFGVAEQLFNDPGVSRQISAWVSAEAHRLPAPPVARPSSRLLYELCASLRDLVRQQPVVIVVDDAQFTDAASLTLLLTILRRLASHRLLVVLAGQNWSLLQHPTFLAEAMRLPHERMQLAPLSPRAIESMLAPSPASVDAAQRAAQIYQLTGGRPILVRALIEDDEALGDGCEWPVIGPTFQAAVVNCLRRCGRKALDVGRGIALLRPDATRASLSRLLNMSEPDVARQLQILDHAGLVSGYDFWHPAAATAVLGTEPTAQRSALSAPAADLLLSLAERRSVAVHEVPEATWSTIDELSRLLHDAAQVPHADASSGSTPHHKRRTRDLLLRSLAISNPAQRERHLKDLVVHLLASGARGELALSPTELRRDWLACRAAEHGTGGPPGSASQAAATDAALFAAAETVRGADELETSTARDCPAAELSDAERRVAELAAGGLSNREISRRLWITVSTVEQHLTRIYRKLGVSGRANIAAAFRPPHADTHKEAGTETDGPAASEGASVHRGADRRQPPLRGVLEAP